jgi:drug/metabolite transporter (DMT)-like permease
MLLTGIAAIIGGTRVLYFLIKKNNEAAKAQIINTLSVILATLCLPSWSEVMGTLKDLAIIDNSFML